MRTSTSGCCARKPSSRGTSHFAASDGEVVTISFGRPSTARSRCTARPMVPSPSATARDRISPAAVRRTTRLERSNSRTARSSSSSRMAWLTAAGVTFSSAAALVKLRCRAAASKPRRAARLTGLVMAPSSNLAHHPVKPNSFENP